MRLAPQMSITPLIHILLLISLMGCRKYCHKDAIAGEIVEIPIQFNGFSLQEIDNIWVYRINKSNPTEIDSFFMRDILWANHARSFDEQITDKNYSTSKTYGRYESYFDNCNLILEWGTGRDTLADFIIKKSEAVGTGCYEGQTYTQIDRFSFTHKGKNISKGEGIQIAK